MDELNTDVVVEGADGAEAVEETPATGMPETHTHVTGSADEADVAMPEEALVEEGA